MEFIIKIVEYLFELRIEIINVILFFIIGFYVCKIVRAKKIRRFIALVLSVFLSLQLVSLYFVNNFIGYQFYVHFNVRDITTMIGIYGFQVILLLVVFLTIFLLFSCSEKVFQFLIQKNAWLKKIHSFTPFKLTFALIFILSLYFMNVEKGIIRTSTELISMLTVEEQEMNASLSKLGITEYTSPEDLEVKGGKNVIVLSLESLERGYLDGTLSHLTPNLNALKKDGIFTL